MRSREELEQIRKWAWQDRRIELLLDHIAALEEGLREIVADLEDDDPAPVDAALQKGRRLLGEGS